MKYAWTILASAFMASFVFGVDPEWKLQWHEDFEGPKLNYAHWEIEVNAFGGGNQELQIYTDRAKNVRVENGLLILEAHRDNAGIAGTVREYSSGRLRSKHRGDWKYGKIDIRAKLPKGQGLWPALWMLPTEEKYGTWAGSGEIDILEFKGQEPHVLWGTLHYGDAWPKNKHSGTQLRRPEVDFTEDFHLYGLEWEEGKIRWLLDGEVWQTQDQWESQGHPFPAPFDQPFHLVLNLAVGGGFVGNPSGDTPFPAAFLIDDIKVFQKK